MSFVILVNVLRIKNREFGDKDFELILWQCYRTMLFKQFILILGFGSWIFPTGTNGRMSGKIVAKNDLRGYSVAPRALVNGDNWIWFFFQKKNLMKFSWEYNTHSIKKTWNAKKQYGRDIMEEILLSFDILFPKSMPSVIMAPISVISTILS